MSDDKSKTGASDWLAVSAGEPYEVADFAKKHGITRNRAEMLIKKFGNDRDAGCRGREAEDAVGVPDVQSLQHHPQPGHDAMCSGLGANPL